MNRFQKHLALLLTAMLLLAALPVAGLAASYKVETLKLNQWYKLQEYSSDMTIYKLRVSGETIVSFSWKGVKTNSNYSGVRIYHDKTCNDSIGYEDIDDTSSGSSAFVLYSGTYYIQMYDGKESGKIRFSTKKASAINKSNYCLSKAITVKAGKKVEIAQTRNNNYYRWYRIKLSKTQTITFNGIRKYDFTLYDSNLNTLSCSNRDDVCVTEGMQPKGTYYLAIERSDVSYLKQKGDYIAFSWK